MASYAEFIVEYPEFAATDASLVAAKMARAVSELDTAVWADLYDNGVYLLTAQKLAKMPTGNTAKLVNKDGSTVYDDDLATLRSIVTGGIRVAGQDLGPTPPLGPFIAVTDASNTSPIVLGVVDTSTLTTGARGYVTGVGGNDGANGSWLLTVVDATHVSLDGSIGTGAYTSGGTLQLIT